MYFQLAVVNNKKSCDPAKEPETKPVQKKKLDKEGKSVSSSKAAQLRRMCWKHCCTG